MLISFYSTTVHGIDLVFRLLLPSASVVAYCPEGLVLWYFNVTFFTFPTTWGPLTGIGPGARLHCCAAVVGGGSVPGRIQRLEVFSIRFNIEGVFCVHHRVASSLPPPILSGVKYPL